MSDWLTRFRALAKNDPRLGGGDDNDKNRQNPTRTIEDDIEDPNTRVLSGIVNFVPIGPPRENPQSSSSAKVALDFETRNTAGCDLTKVGAWRYAADPATEILTATYYVEGKYHLWTPAKGLEGLLAKLAADPAVRFIAHNTGFEQAIWQRIMVEQFGFPPIPIARWHDTMAACGYHAVPLKFEEALPALGLGEKDKEGSRFTIGLSKRDKKTGACPEITPERLARVAKYNRIDVEGTVALDDRLGRLPKRERRVWELDQVINQRGVAIDREFVHAAKTIADHQLSAAVDEFRELTGVNPTQVAKVRDWLGENGTELDNMQAETIEAALKLELSPEARRVIEIRAMAASSSLKKLDRMLACVEADGRVRGLFQYHKATTGRWAGLLVQPQNFPKPTVKIKDPEALVAAVRTGDAKALRPWGEPLEVLVSSLRYAVIAPGDTLFGAGDFIGIEARIVLALAGQKDKVELLAAGADIYRDMAVEIFKLDEAAKAPFLATDKKLLTLEQAAWRDAGKAGTLGCGFGMGADRLSAANEQLDKALAQRVIDTYRNTWAPKVKPLWRDLEFAAKQAVSQPGATFEADCGIRYRVDNHAGVPILQCRLINGKLLHYYNAGLALVSKPWGEEPAVTYWAKRGHKGDPEGTKGLKWRKVDTWGGKLTENVVQAMARELLLEAMLRFEERGYPVVLHAHDEIVVEHPDATEAIVEEIMVEAPVWARAMGLPIAVEAWVGKRYRK